MCCVLLLVGVVVVVVAVGCGWWLFSVWGLPGLFLLQLLACTRFLFLMGASFSITSSIYSFSSAGAGISSSLSSSSVFSLSLIYLHLNQPVMVRCWGAWLRVLGGWNGSDLNPYTGR